MKHRRNNSLSSTSSDLSGWSELPPDLLERIFCLLSASDRHRVRLICSNWRAIVRQSNPPFPVPFEPPRLLVTRPDKSISFFNLFKCKSLSCSLPPAHRQARCFGYLAGWFFLCSHKNPTHVCLFNPVMNAEIPLPNLQFPIIKAILRASPGFPDCVVAVMGRSNLIALCEPAGKVWHVLDLGKYIIADIVFWRNQLCGADIHGSILICNFNMKSRKTRISTVLSQLWQACNQVFLVESTSGDLLVVVHFSCYCRVFKLNQDCSWELVAGIGDQALFLSVIRSESVPVHRFLGTGLRENSIYLSSRKFRGRFGLAKVYSMDDVNMEAMPVSERCSTLDELTWISPVIWP